MKSRMKNLIFLPVLIAGLALLLADQATAQIFTTLHSFTATDPSTGTNRDGADPIAGLILSGNTLYGTAYKGGTNGNGTVFKVNTNGTGFTNLHTFTATDPHTGTNRDGSYPTAGLILSGNTLYGRQVEAAPMAMARCLRSTPMARVLPLCILSPQLIPIPEPTEMEPIHMPV